MKISNIDIDAALGNVRQQLKDDPTVSPSLRAAIELLMTLIQLLTGRLNTNSRNSSKPPSQDPNRPKTRRSTGERKPGGQPGRVGKTLQQVADPDAIKTVKVDRRTLPKGRTFRSVGYERRQVFELDIRRFITEYQAEILEDEQGNRIVAPFPSGVDRAVQYGPGLKAHAVYLSLYQLLPYERVVVAHHGIGGDVDGKHPGQLTQAGLDPAAAVLVVLAGGMILPAEEGTAHAAGNDVVPGRCLEGDEFSAWSSHGLSVAVEGRGVK
jgi:transposase